MYAQHIDVLEYAHKKNLLNYGYPEPYLPLSPELALFRSFFVVAPAAEN